MYTRQRFPSFSRRTAVAGLGASGLALAASRLGAAAQAASPPAMATHPLVGTWYFDFDPEHPGTLFAFTIFHADGTRTDVHPFAGPGIAAWRATGERTGESILKYLNIAEKPGDIVPGLVTVWESLAVNESGDSYTAEAVVELRAIDGTIIDRFAFTGEPSHRLTVEPPPPPLETSATPVATPAP